MNPAFNRRVRGKVPPVEGHEKVIDLAVPEVQLETGSYRFRARGSAGGHNGLKSIEQALGGQEYARLRIGVGPSDPERRVGDLADYVLDKFGKAERETVRGLLSTLEDGLRCWIADGIERTMNAFNR